MKDGNFHGGKLIPDMDIETPRQFVEYCSKVEKIDMPLEAADFILKFESEIGGRFYVKQDVLYRIYLEGTILKTGYKTDLFQIKERMEEEISCCEWFWGLGDIASMEQALLDCSAGVNFDVALEELLEEAAKCKYYHQIFDPIWRKLGPAKHQKPYETANLVWKIAKQEE